MAIRVYDKPEPFTPASKRLGGTTLAASQAYEVLSRDLHLYAKGIILGRSYLIAGLRGAGKTTAVMKAIEDTAALLKKESASRLVPIRLYGPDMLPDQKPKPSVASAATLRAALGTAARDGAGETRLESDPDADIEVERPDSHASDDEWLNYYTIVVNHYVPREVVRRFYPAAVAEIHEELRNEALMSTDERRSSLLELAAYTRVKLEETRELPAMAALWRQMNALSKGTLGYLENRPPDQGLLELIALWSSAQAYRTAIGTTIETDSDKTSTSGKSSITKQTAIDVKNALSPLLAVVGGVAVGAGLTPAHGGLAGALAGAATGLALAFSLRYSSSRSREKSQVREVTFTPDRSIKTLGRTLPALVEHFRMAGLAPVFVVDELDKIDHLAQFMEAMVKRLKQFVTERSFFCFIAPREYLENLRRRSGEDRAAIEHTLFSETLYVLLRPRDLHEYLVSVGTDGKPAGLLQSDGVDTADLEVLPYVLLHRARMHPIELRRVLSQLTDRDGRVTFPANALRSPLGPYWFEVLIQVAIEWLLGEDPVREYLAYKPDFRPLLYDTLYYPSRIWAKSDELLDCSEQALLHYLSERAGLRPATASNGGSAAGPPSPTGPATQNPPFFSEVECNFLLERLRRLISFLLEPVELFKLLIASQRASAGEFKTQVIEVVNSVANLRPFERLLERTEQQHIYRWLRDPTGQPIRRLAVDTFLTDDLQRADDLIDFVNKTVTEVSQGTVDLGRLAEFCVLPSSPPWATVQLAHQNLAPLRQKQPGEEPAPYPEMEADGSSIWAYAKTLEANGELIGRALICAAAVGKAAGATGGDQFVRGLGSLTSVLKLETMPSPSAKLEKLRSLSESVKPLLVDGSVVDRLPKKLENL